jgi:hypothetical protein
VHTIHVLLLRNGPDRFYKRAQFQAPADRLSSFVRVQHQEHTRIRICQHGANRQQHFRDGQCWGPLLPENVQTNAAVAVDVWVVNSSREIHLDTA